MWQRRKICRRLTADSRPPTAPIVVGWVLPARDRCLRSNARRENPTGCGLESPRHFRKCRGLSALPQKRRHQPDHRLHIRPGPSVGGWVLPARDRCLRSNARRENPTGCGLESPRHFRKCRGLSALPQKRHHQPRHRFHIRPGPVKPENVVHPPKPGGLVAHKAVRLDADAFAGLLQRQFAA